MTHDPMPFLFPDTEPADELHASSPTAHLLDELALYGHRPGQDEPDPRPLPEADAVRAELGAIIDGFAANDPASETYFGWAKQNSGIEIPDKTLDFYDVKDVPHGDVRIHWYRSKITGAWRRAYVYVPAGYDRDTRKRYPALYLQHGSGESERVFQRCGLAKRDFVQRRFAAHGVVVMRHGFEPLGRYGDALSYASQKRTNLFRRARAAKSDQHHGVAFCGSHGPGFYATALRSPRAELVHRIDQGDDVIDRRVG